MKNAIRTLAIVAGFAFASNAFATGAAPSTGTGVFKCTVVAPMTITADAGTADLGIILPTDEKTVFETPETTKLTWNIAGVPGVSPATVGHKYFYKITPVVSDAVVANPTANPPVSAVPATVTLSMDWTIVDGSNTTAGTPALGTTTPSLLALDGSSKIEANVTKVVTTAATLGDHTFTQKVEVSYATF